MLGIIVSYNYFINTISYPYSFIYHRNIGYKKGKKMALLPMISDEEAGPEAQVVFKHSTKMYGRVANFVLQHIHLNWHNQYMALPWQLFGKKLPKP